MTTSKEDFESWTNLSTTDAQSFDNITSESQKSSSDRRNAQLSRQLSDDGVTSPLRDFPDISQERTSSNTTSASNDPKATSIDDASRLVYRPIPEADRNKAQGSLNLSNHHRSHPEITPDESACDEPDGRAEGSWWSHLTATVKQAANGVADDLTELNKSVHTLIANKVEEEAEASEPGRETKTASLARSVDPKTDGQRQATLSRLEGQETVLQAELRAFDDQMEQLAGGLSQAFGSFWGSARGAVTTGLSLGQKVAEKVEQAAQDLNSFVEDLDKQHSRETHASYEDDSGQQGPPSQATKPSFQYHWQASGGQKNFEQVQLLSRKAARMYNSLVRKMGPVEQKETEDILSHLKSILDLQRSIAMNKSQTSQKIAEESEPPKFDCPVLFQLTEKGILAAKKLTAERPRTQQNYGSFSQGNDDGTAWLENIYAQAVQLLAEACCASLEHLLRLARSLLAHRLGEHHSSNIEWPRSPSHKAILLRQQVEEMKQNLQQLVDAFDDSIAETAAQMAKEAPEAKEHLLEVAEALCSTLKINCTTASAHIQDAFGSLLYVVALSAEGILES